MLARTTSDGYSDAVSSLKNEFRPFATAEGAHVIDQAEYEKADFLKTGFKKGLARSSEINKALRQSASVASAVAQFTMEKSGQDVLDNGDTGLLKTLFETALKNVSSLLIAEARGTENALEAVFEQTVEALTPGLLVHVRAIERNTEVMPTLKVNGLAAKGIVKGNNVPLLVGDIAGAGHWLALQYDEKLDKWVLQNPAKGVALPSGVPVGAVEYFAASVPPAGYLKADGSAVGRATYPDLFAAIGTVYGEGDGETTFNLPDLMGRFAEGNTIPGTVKEAGLPNVTGTFTVAMGSGPCDLSGAFEKGEYSRNGVSPQTGNFAWYKTNFNAKQSNPIYGASGTVQPPALTLLPCVKAFDALTDPGLIDVGQLAQDVVTLTRNMAGKVDKVIDGKNTAYIVDSYTDEAGNWCRQWSDGWMEQCVSVNGSGGTATFLYPYADTNYFACIGPVGTASNDYVLLGISDYKTTSVSVTWGGELKNASSIRVYTCGQKAQS